MFNYPNTETSRSSTWVYLYMSFFGLALLDNCVPLFPHCPTKGINSTFWTAALGISSQPQPWKIEIVKRLHQKRRQDRRQIQIQWWMTPTTPWCTAPTQWQEPTKWGAAQIRWKTTPATPTWNIARLHSGFQLYPRLTLTQSYTAQTQPTFCLS